MSINRIKRCLTPFLLLFLASGCASERIPFYPPMPAAQAMAVLAKRAHAIQTISAQGLITLTRADGDTIRLDAAIVLQPPQHARLRAWKFTQAVFDLTCTPEGLWLLAPRDDRRREELRAAGTRTGKLISEWLRLMTGTFDGPQRATREDGRRLIIQQPTDQGAMMICQVDRKTLTPRRYALRDADGMERFTLSLDRYIEVGGVVWPRRIDAASDTGRIRIELREVEINGEVPATAFHPPARAEKIDDSTPSPGTPGEGRGEGSSHLESQISNFESNPHPNPPPEYRGRGRTPP